MIYLKYHIEGLEGLCNQLMAIFRAIGEATFYSSQNLPVCIILNDVQTRNSIDLDKEPYFSPIPVDSFVDVDKLTNLLGNYHIAVERLSLDNSREERPDNQNQVVACRRFPRRFVLPDESKNLGILVAKSFPFSKRVLGLASYIIDFMSRYPNWQAIHLRIEGDLIHLSSVRSTGFNNHVQNQFHQSLDMLSSAPRLPAAYLASGVQDERFREIVAAIQERFPGLAVYRKKDILKTDDELMNEYDSLCLEQQALIDWLVCLDAPLFAGSHASSFAYLAGYMRHYRGLAAEATQLYPEYQPLWDDWFPRV